MSRIIPPNHRSITGSLPTRFHVRQLAYESKLERDFLILLEIDLGLKAVVTQPMTIDLTVDNRKRSYTPDVMVRWWENAKWPFGKERVVFEVKPYEVLRRDFAKLVPKLRAAKSYFAARGIGFRVITDRSIYTPRQANAVRLGPQMRTPLCHATKAAVRDIMINQGTTNRSFGEVRQFLTQDGMFRNVAQDALYHLLGTGFLVADLNAPLDDSTMMKWWSIVAVEELENDSGLLQHWR